MKFILPYWQSSSWFRPQHYISGRTRNVNAVTGYICLRIAEVYRLSNARFHYWRST